MRIALVLLLAIEPAFCECIQINGPVIHARDLASSIAAFAAAAPETIVGRTPSPGVRRAFSPRELTAAERAAGIAPGDLPATGTCVERAVRQLTEQEIAAAMTEAFPGKVVRISIVDRSRYGVPGGRLVFRLTGLNDPPFSQPDVPVLWRGRVLFDDTRSMEVWARVRITTMTKTCLAVSDIMPGRPIETEQIRIAELPRFPSRRGGSIDRTENVAGRVSRRPIRAGEEIVGEMLEKPHDVLSGDTVRVLAISGNARITLDAVATTGGRKGDTIVLRNPSSQASFRAVVDGKDRALVRASLGDGS
jgi:flagella basal body P-ring formation protein FlgA